MTLASARLDGVVSAGVAPFPDVGAVRLPTPRFPSPDRRATRTYMPVIKVNDQQYLLRPGPNRVGAGADADINVADNAALGVQAIVDVEDGAAAHAVIRSARSGAAVRVNGVPLVDPTPLMHGDKVEIAGRELLFAEDGRAGATQFVSADEVARAAARPPTAGRATASTGGRLVSLVDGKEYLVPSGGLTIGRDAASDVVVPQNEVSRTHARVIVMADGYEVRDSSANGVFVNGVRVANAQKLSRADVIRVGDEELRFYADVPPAVVAKPAIPAESATSTQASDSAAAVVAPTVAADARPALAVLEVTNEGPTNGTRYEIRVPLAHVGRGAHNDVVIPEPSVSETHAKLERREDGWCVIDLGSTNGTFVGGQRLPGEGERAIYGGLSLRFGGVKVIFRPGDVAAGTDRGARDTAHADQGALRDAPAAAAPQVTTAPPIAPSPSGALPRWVWLAVVVAVAAAVIFFLLNR
jgi:pSer/pThr/pTyr-binding forkhead associated (FHA) protein